MEKKSLGITLERKESFVYKNRDYIQCKTGNRNDCWNIALSLATKKKYQKVREAFKGEISKDGGLRGVYTHDFLNKEGFVPTKKNNLKTILGVIKETKKTGASYIVVTSGHMAYVENGELYDNHDSHLRRVRVLYVKEK